MILGLLEVDLVLHEHVFAEVARQVAGLDDVDDEVHTAVHQILRLFWQIVFSDILVTFCVDRDYIDVEGAVVLVVGTYKVDDDWVVDEISQWFKTVITFADHFWLIDVHEGVVIVIETVDLALLFVSGEQVSHHHESIHELVSVPAVLLICILVVHLDLDIVGFLSTCFERVQNIVSARQTKAKCHILSKLLGKLIGLVNQRLNLSRHRRKLYLVSLLILNLFLVLKELLLLLFNLALMLGIFLLHSLAS